MHASCQDLKQSPDRESSLPGLGSRLREENSAVRVLLGHTHLSSSAVPSASLLLALCALSAVLGSGNGERLGRHSASAYRGLSGDSSPFARRAAPLSPAGMSGRPRGSRDSRTSYMDDGVKRDAVCERGSSLGAGGAGGAAPGV